MGQNLLDLAGQRLQGPDDGGALRLFELAPLLRQGHGVLEGVEDPGEGGLHGSDPPRPGEPGPELLPVQEPEAPAAVPVSLVLQAAEGGQVCLVKGHQELAGDLVGHVQLVAQGGKAPAALDAEPGHQASGPVVEPRVDDGGVPPAGPGGHVGGGLRQGHRHLIAGQLPCHGAAHGPAADDEDVEISVCQGGFAPFYREKHQEAGLLPV